MDRGAIIQMSSGAGFVLIPRMNPPIRLLD